MKKPLIIPKHVGIIMDGNGRWAKKRLLPPIMGHKKGAEVFKKISKHCAKSGIKYFTAYAFSTENWNRSKDEISGLMNLFKDYLEDFFISRNDYQGYKVKFIGDKNPLNQDIKDFMNKIELETDNCDGINVNIAINYGGRQEIVKAAKEIAMDVATGKIKADMINMDLLSSYLYTCGQPDTDLIIRTSGEKRLSNFLLWQSSYSEFVFTDVLWPDFNEDHFDEAINEYIKRQRRYGG